MKNMVLYILLVAASIIYPKEKTDVGKLRPVEVVHIYKGNQVMIATDTGDMGRGSSIKEALEDLKWTTPGTVYLDTADFLLISESCIEEIGNIKPIVRGNTRICIAEPNVDLTKAAEYLSVHKPETKLNEAGGKRIQHLKIKNGSLKLE